MSSGQRMKHVVPRAAGGHRRVAAPVAWTNGLVSCHRCRSERDVTCMHAPAMKQACRRANVLLMTVQQSTQWVCQRESAVCRQGIGRHGFRVLVIMPVYLANFGLSVPAALRTEALITQLLSPHRLALRRSVGPSCGRRRPHMEDTGSERVAPCARVHSSACAAGWRRGRRRLWRPCWVLSAPSTPTASTWARRS